MSFCDELSELLNIHPDKVVLKNGILIDEKEMIVSKLTLKDRKKIPKKEFGLPAEKKYPMPDKSHAANAKARATQMVEKGKLSVAQKAKIDAKANKVLGKKSTKKGK